MYKAMKIKKIYFDQDRLFIETDEGRTKSQPLSFYPRLENATTKERNEYTISPFGIHWPRIDEDVSFESFDYKTETAIIKRSKEGNYSIFTPDLNPPIKGKGSTVTEAKADFEKKIMKADMKELQNTDFDFKFDVASLFNYYSWINVSKFAEIAKINASLMRQYKSGMQYISEAQLAKIEEALHRVGHEISGIKLTGS